MEERRVLSIDEIKKRGCYDCADRVARIGCRYTSCPYHELDGYATYGEYLKNEKLNIPTLYF